MTFCFTGKLTLFTRNEARSYVQNAGHRWSASVTSDVNYLVMADPNSTSLKAKKARQLGINLISETEFMDMLSISTNDVIKKKAEMTALKDKEPATWKKCFNCVVKNLGLKSSVKWNGYDYDKMKKADVEVTVYYLVNNDLPGHAPDKVILAVSGFVYGTYTTWYGRKETNWQRVQIDDLEKAYESVLRRLLNSRLGLEPNEPSHLDRALGRIKVWRSPESKQPIPEIPNIEFDSPDELQLMLASYGWNVDIDE